MFHRVILDYGHGWRTPKDAKQYTYPDGWTIWEGEPNRRIMHDLATMLLGVGVTVLDAVACREIRDFEDLMEMGPLLERGDTPLERRVRFANAHWEGSIVCSQHCNAIGKSIQGPSLPAKGVSLFTSVGQTTADVLADALYESFDTNVRGMKVRHGDWSDGDRDHEADFYVLRKTKAPAVLAETGFFTNRDDAEFLMSRSGQEEVARAWFLGLLPFLEVPL